MSDPPRPDQEDTSPPPSGENDQQPQKALAVLTPDQAQSSITSDLPGFLHEKEIGSTGLRADLWAILRLWTREREIEKVRYLDENRSLRLELREANVKLSSEQNQNTGLRERLKSGALGAFVMAIGGASLGAGLSGSDDKLAWVGLALLVGGFAVTLWSASGKTK